MTPTLPALRAMSQGQHTDPQGREWLLWEDRAVLAGAYLPVLHDATSTYVDDGETLTQYAEFLPSAGRGCLPCSTCRMVANIDPDFHTGRYGHLPTLRVEGVQWRWDPGMQRFAALEETS